MKKGSTCPYCGRKLVWDAFIEKWICIQCGDIETELLKVKAGEYR